MAVALVWLLTSGPGAVGPPSLVLPSRSGPVAPAPTTAPSVPGPSAPPAAAPPPPVPNPGSGTATSTTSVRTRAGTGGAVASPVVSPPAASPGTGIPKSSTTVAAPAVSCQTDLSLAQSPDTGYNFLCTQGGKPLSWASSRITVYEGPLPPVQQIAMSEALTQWQAVAGFTVTMVPTPSAAQVTVTAADLMSGQPGFTEDGYTTVSYICSPACVYDQAEVVLSSAVDLSRSDWLSTDLHELGHVAGLNHVADARQVMYPQLSPSSPVVYASGDRAGLAVLASERQP